MHLKWALNAFLYVLNFIYSFCKGMYSELNVFVLFFQPITALVAAISDVLILILLVDGGFSTWSSFGSCSKTCGYGQKERSRTCTNPAPAHGGDDCVGETSESMECKIKECPSKNLSVFEIAIKFFL